MTRSTRYLIVALLAAVLIGLSAILEVALSIPSTESVFHKPHTLISFLNELGFAFLISFIIIVSLEQGSRDEFNKTVNERITHIQDNVFRSTFSRNLPRALIDEVDTLVLRADFIREGHTCTYRFQFSNSQELNPQSVSIPILLAKVSVSYRIRNVSGIRQPCTINAGVEKSPVEGLDGFVKIVSLHVNNTNQPQFSQTHVGNFLRMQYQAGDLDPGDALTVLITYQAIKHVRDFELWRSLVPSDNMTLRVQFPVGNPNCGINALHRANMNPGAIDEANGYYEWFLDQAILPHQGIIFWWDLSHLPHLKVA